MWAFFTLAAAAALTMPFPTQVDEIQHFSVIRAQFEHPALFPDWSGYRVLRPDALDRWSAEHNYINHPSLYYLLLSPLMALTTQPLVYRLIDVVLATAAFLLVVVAGQRRLAENGGAPVLFALLAASFPKAVSVAGMVNNDNLAALAGALLFAGVSGLAGEAWWLAAGLALAGWTKLTALVALAGVAYIWIVSGAVRARRWPSPRLVLAATAGLLLGSVPYLVTLGRTGHLLWINETYWRVPLAARAHFDFPHFASWFVLMFLTKWPAIERPYPLTFIIVAFVTPLVLAGVALWRIPRTRAIVGSYLSGFLFLFAIQFAFAWKSFQALGDLTNTQTRYYNVLWPGIAFGASIALSRLHARFGRASWPLALLVLLPTALGSSIVGALLPV